jgi:hypothetical protein
VRQLENAVFRAVVLADGDELGVAEFPQIAAHVDGLDVRVPPAPAMMPPMMVAQREIVRVEVRDPNMMRLLELPEPITDAIQREIITAGHAKALLSLGSVKQQLEFVKQISTEGWSVRETESRVADAVAEAAASEDGILKALPRRRASKSDQLAALERDLKMSLGTRVDISQTSRGRGRVTIHFTSIEEFDRIRQLLSQSASHAKRAA